MQEETTWKDLLTPKLFEYICTECEDQFERNSSPTCQKCMKRSEASICHDCKLWQQILTTDPLEQNISIYTYNDFMKDAIARFKYRGDYEIQMVWRKIILETFKKYFIHDKLTIMPIPLSEERHQERGFNQAEALATSITYEPDTKTLIRIDSGKQSKKSRYERMHSANPFQTTQPPPKHILLIDDIFTTGTTIRQCAQTLKQAGAQSIKSLTLIRS